LFGVMDLTAIPNHTQDRIRGVKGSKVLRTRKVAQTKWNTGQYFSFYSNFCSQGCYNDFANKYAQQIIAIAPRTEALETPVNITRDSQPDRWGSYNTQITTVDNNGG